MKMMIDEAIKHLKRILMNEKENQFYVFSIDSISVALNTMQKYQKIVDIVSLNGEEFKQCGLKELKEILEVIADGNDD